MPRQEGSTEAQKRRIREKLADGTLPRELGAAAPVAPAGQVPMMIGRPRVAPCDACDQVGMTRPIGGRLWHDGCFIFCKPRLHAEDGPWQSSAFPVRLTPYH
jgi:hypothetical protein